MRAVVIYASQSGNTKKVALAIADALQCPATQLQPVDDHGTSFTPTHWENYDLFLLGSGITVGHFAQKIRAFVETLAPQLKQKTFGFFCTWAGRGTSARDAVRELKDIAEQHGHHIIPKSFACYGQTMWVVHPDCPNAEDLAKAKEWAEYTITTFLGKNPPDS
jgi:flavodoxin